jgi:hypothetical protein
MPPLNWPINDLELIRNFEAKHKSPDAGALFGWTVWAVESLYYLDDLDRHYDSTRDAIGGHPHDIIDVAHCRWATGTCITALDLCAAGLGEVFCEHRGKHKLSVADFDSKARYGKTRRAQLPIAALNWIDAVRGDHDYKNIKEARRWLTHARMLRHFKLGASGPSRLELQIGEFRLGTRPLIELARDVATKHVIALLKELPNLSQKEHEPRTTFFERKSFLDDLAYVLDQTKAQYAYWQTNADCLLADSPIRQTIRNAVLESSLCFLRKVNEFFGKSPGEISVRDYLPSEPQEYLLSKEDSILLNERVMHLSLKEARNGKHNWKNFLDRYVPEADRRYREFLKKLREAHPEYFSSGEVEQ